MRAIDDVLVVGAGLAGMTLATALKRSRLRPEVVEIHPRFDVLGVRMSIQGPALRVLKSIGLIDQCVQAGFGCSFRLSDCRPERKIEGIVGLPRLNGPQYPSCVGLMRPALHSILYQAMSQAGIPVRFGLTARSIRPISQRHGILEFSDGTHGTYDLVVGADGASSTIRQALFGPEFTPSIHGPGGLAGDGPSSTRGDGAPRILGPAQGRVQSGVDAGDVHLPRPEPQRGPPPSSPRGGLRSCESCSRALAVTSARRAPVSPIPRAWYPSGRVAAVATALVQRPRPGDRRRGAHLRAPARERGHHCDRRLDGPRRLDPIRTPCGCRRSSGPRA